MTLVFDNRMEHPKFGDRETMSSNLEELLFSGQMPVAGEATSIQLPFTNTEYLPEYLASIMQNQNTETALDAKIVTKYTALVAVDVTPTKPIDMQSNAVDVANTKAAHLSRQHHAKLQQGQVIVM